MFSKESKSEKKGFLFEGDEGKGGLASVSGIFLWKGKFGGGGGGGGLELVIFFTKNLNKRKYIFLFFFLGWGEGETRLSENPN